MSENPPMADGGPVPDCCPHLTTSEYGCTDCLNTGHAHDPADPCPPEPQTTPQDAREGGRNSLEGVPGGERTSQGADGASGGSLGDRLRAAADYQDRPGAYDELRAMADEADRMERERHDADGHYHRVVGELSALRGRLDATRGDLAAQERITAELQPVAQVVHTVRTRGGVGEIAGVRIERVEHGTTASMRRLERAHATVGRALVLAAEWAEAAQEACDGEDHGGTCADCAGRGYASELLAVLDGADRPAEVLVEGSYFPVADLPRVLGNFMRSSADYARQAKEAHAKVERVRALADQIILQPCGLSYAMQIRAALDGETEARRGVRGAGRAQAAAQRALDEQARRDGGTEADRG